MKVVTILGARPQFVKASVVSRAWRAAQQQEVIVHTGQHFDANMSQVFFDELDIPRPDYHLDIHGLNHGAMTGRMLEKIEQVLLDEKPDVVVVYGDTNSTLAGALAASKLHIPLAHVEAGLRSFDMQMPEEVNRILTDRVSNYLFCPTSTAVKNLKQEGFDHFDCRIYQVGDVMYDSVMHFKEKIKDKALPPGIKAPFVLATLHRQENTEDLQRLGQLIDALNEVHQTMPVVMPIHPRTKNLLSRHGIKTNFTMLDPLGYLDMLLLLQHCRMVMTDSGGLQKEAYFFQKYCITLRDQTEWVELIEAGVNALAGADSKKILDQFNKVLELPPISSATLYGNGQAANEIVTALVQSST